MLNVIMLYIIATPIGNLEDITLRALRILKEVNLIACEDTRVTKKLLNHYDIKTSLISYHQHSRIAKVDYLIGELKKGKDIALVTDAGAPGISDPGNILVAEVLKNGMQVSPIPGASALTTLISAAGINTQKFIFLGFPPHKKGRKTFFQEVISQKYPVIYYDSVHRVIKNLKLLKELKKENLEIIIGRELTKMHEEIIRGSVGEILEHFEKNPEKLKGEFAVIAETLNKK